MKEIVLNNLDQSVFVENLDNGLKVILIPMKNKGNYYANYTSKYGSINLNFKCNGKTYKSPKGIAHFLEHKMFEQPDGGDVFDYYSKTGTECNAGTSYKKTSYYIYGINNLKENLDYLITLVNSPYFTDENVEKEKGIIVQELKMYADDPDWILSETLKKATYKNHPIKYDIGGYEDTVNSITKDDLYKCYNEFYKPSNMVLVVSGNFDLYEILDVIKNNEALNSRKDKSEIIEVKEKEPLEILKQYQEILNPSVTVPKININFKISIKDCKDKNLYMLYISALLSILFGNVSSFNEDMFKKGYASYVDCNRMLLDDLLIIEFYAEGEKPKELLNEIIKRFKDEKITEEELNRFKKVSISSNVINSDKSQNIAECILSDYLNFNTIYEDRIGIIKSMNFEEFKKIRNELNVDNNATVFMKKEE